MAPGKTHLRYSAPRTPSQPGLPGPTQGHTRGSGERVTDTGAATWNNTENESRVVGLTHWMTHFLAQGCSEHPPRAESRSSPSSHPLFPFCGEGPEKSTLPPRRAGSGMVRPSPSTQDRRRGRLEDPFPTYKITVPTRCILRKNSFVPWNPGENLDSFCPFPDYHRDPCTP